MPTRVFVDANVLFSRTQRDWLHHLRRATGGRMFTIYTSEDVIAETMYRYRRRHLVASGEVIANIRRAVVTMMDEIVTQYEIDLHFPLHDENDLHVHAAASASAADTLLTNDQGWERLSEAVLDALSYEVCHPDEFFSLIDRSQQEAVSRALDAQLEYWLPRRPDGVDLVSELRAADCPTFADRLQARLTARALTP